MKDKVTVHLRRRPNGEVIGDIINEKGEVVSSRSFGAMTEDEFKNGMQQVKQEFPGACIWLIVDVDGN